MQKLLSNLFLKFANAAVFLSLSLNLYASRSPTDLSLLSTSTPSSSYAEAATTNDNIAKCPAIAELSKSLDEFKGSNLGPLKAPSLKCANGSDLPPHNIKILTAAATIPPKGGYKFKGEGAKPLNFKLNPCAGSMSSMLSMEEDNSYCSGSGLATLLMSAGDSVCEADGTFNEAKYGLKSPIFSTLNNDGTQMGDLAPALGIGTVITKEPGQEVMTNLGVCPGDYVNFSRPISDDGKMYGHAAVLMGIVDGKMYWWSSQSASSGWGIDCVEIEKISSGDFAITRVDRPENLKNYDVAKLRGTGDGDKALVDNSKQHVKKAGEI